MPIKEGWIGSKKPATQGNLADLQEDIHADLQQFATKQDLKDELKKYATKEDLKKATQNLMTKETGEELLGLIQSIDKRLKKHEGLPERVTAVENDVFKLKLRR